MEQQKRHNIVKSDSSTPTVNNGNKSNVFETINIFPNDDGYLCLICNKKFDTIQASSNHTTGTEHRETLDIINNSCININGLIGCKFCSSFLAADLHSFLIHFHVNINHFNSPKTGQEKTHNGIAKVSSIPYLILEANQIIEPDVGIYFCCCCGKRLSSLPDVISHIKGEKHRNLQKSCGFKDFYNNKSEHESEELVKGLVSCVTSSNYYCYVCDRLMNGVKNCHQHIRGYDHTTEIKRKADILYQPLSEKVKISGDSVRKIVKTDKMKVAGVQQVQPKIEQQKTTSLILEANQIIEPDVGTYFCCCCGKSLSRLVDVISHIEDKEHRKLQKSCEFKDFYKNKPEHESEELVKGLVSRVDFSNYYCYLCDRLMSGGFKNCHQHIRGYDHTTEMKRKAEILYQPLSEKVKISGNSVRKIVKTDKTKVAGVQQVQPKIEQQKTTYLILEANQIIEPDVGTYFCCCCGKSLSRLVDVISHIEEKEHRKLQESCKFGNFDRNKPEHESEELVKGLVSRVNFSYYYCYLCDCLMNGGLNNCHQHIKGYDHTSEMKRKAEILYQPLSEKVKISGDSVQKIVKTDKIKVAGVQQVQPKIEQQKTTYLILEANQIIEPDVGTYFCCCCGKSLSRLVDVISHIEEKEHKKFQKSCEFKDFDKNKPEHESKELVKGLVSCVTSSNYYCYVCDRLISGVKNCHQHIKGYDHTMEMKRKADILYQPLSEKVKISGYTVQKIVKTDKTKVAGVQQVQPKIEQQKTRPELFTLENSNSSTKLVKNILISAKTLSASIDRKSEVSTAGQKSETNQLKSLQSKLAFVSPDLDPSVDPFNSRPAAENRSSESGKRIIGTGTLLSAPHRPDRLLTVPHAILIPDYVIPLISKHLLQYREKGILYCPACEVHINDPENVIDHVVSREHIAEISSYRAKITQKDTNLGDTLEKSNSSTNLVKNRLTSEKPLSASIDKESKVSTAGPKSATNQAIKSSQSKSISVSPNFFRLDRSPSFHTSDEIKPYENVLGHVIDTKQKTGLEVCKSKLAQECKSTNWYETLNTNKTMSSLIHSINNKPPLMKSQNNVTTCHRRLMDIPKKFLPLISVHSLRHLKDHIYCPACDVRMEDPTSLVNHTNSLKHTARLELFRTKTVSKDKTQKTLVLDVAKSGCKVGEARDNSFVNEIEQSLKRIEKVSETLTGLEKSVYKLTITKLKKKQSIEGNNNKILKQPANQSKNIKKPLVKQMSKRSCYDPKYLKVEMGYIYEVNPEKMRIMKLSCQLCFPSTSSEVYCSICEKSVPSESQTFYEHICSVAHIQYLAEAEEEDKLFKPYPEEISDLSLAKEFMQQTPVDEIIKCLACDANMDNDDVVISKHIELDSHKEAKRVWNYKMEKILQDVLAKTEITWYNIRKYLCQPCGVIYNSEFNFSEHVHSKKHNKCLNEMGTSVDKLVYDSCVPCATLWLGFSETCTEHLNDPTHENVRKQGEEDSVCILPGDVKTLLENSEAKVDEMIKLSDQVLTVEKVKVEKLLKCLEDTVIPAYRKAKAYPFGSRVSGLGFPDSDIDVFLDCGNYYKNESTNYSQLTTILSVEGCLRTNQNLWTVERTVLSSRTPIIRLRHKETSLNCDVSFTNGLSVENTKLLKCFINNYPLSRKLMLFIKKWLHFCNLSGSKLITNYAICWYTIFYLQCKSILPSVANLIAKKNKSKLIDGWETGICEKFDKSQDRFTFTELLRGFFVFYANFDCRSSVACPLLGRVVSKQNFTVVNTLPKEMAPYIKYVTKGSDHDAERFRIDSVMCIQDPYDLSHNLTKAVSKSTLNRFRLFCAASANILDNAEHH